MHVRHDVVPQLALVLRGFGEIDIVDVLPQLLDLARSDGHAKSASASAKATHNRRQVENLRCGPQSRDISGEA
jgi:hypothetical protein